MKSNKVVLSTMAGLCTLLLTGAPSAQAAFQDTAGHWAQAAIDRMQGYQIVNGFGGQFRPDDTITRGEMAVVLDHVMRYQNRADNYFTDLGQAFYTDAILKAGHAGVLQGADGKVRPNDAISREEAVVMMARAFDIETTNVEAIHVPDAGGIAGWATDAVAAFINKGYVNGTEAFRPKEPITRAETVAILNRILTGYYPNAGSFSESADGTVVVNTQDVSLKDMTIAGDLILSEGVQDGDVTLENVVVNGRVLIRGGGVNSIHVLGKSVLGTVVMERDGAAVRLAVDGKDAKVEHVKVGEKAAEAIVAGDVSSVTVAGSGKLTAQDAKIGTIMVTAPDAAVALAGNSQVKSVEVAQDAKNTELSVDKGTSVETVEIKAAGADVSGEGKVSTVKANADNISVDTKGTVVKAAKGTTGITAGGQKVPSGGSINSTPSKNNSSSGGSSSSDNDRPSRPEKLEIERVESVKNGLVRVTLNRATDTALRQDQFSIICTGGGSDMTIVSVKTTDNRVYDLTTAYYDDNTYQLGITLDDQTLLTYDFVSKYDCPELTSIEAVRTTAEEATFSYVSDTSGTFYWLLVEKPNTRFRRAANGDPTAEEIMASGNQQEMKLHSNTVTLTGLKPDTAYSMYYVAKGIDEKVTPVRLVEIAGTPADKPEASDIQIKSAAAHVIPDADLTDELVYFEVVLDKPTAQTLTVDQFEFTCPAQGTMKLKRVETDDNQTYKVYMQNGYMPQDNNHFTCTITFADGKEATHRFFVDFTAPILTNVQITRTDKNMAQVTFKSSEAGEVYWKVMKGSDFGADNNSPKDPELVLDGEHQEIEEGTQYFDFEIPADMVDEKDIYFCFATEDAAGNVSTTLDYEKIPDKAVDPEPEPEPSEYVIEKVTGKIDDGYKSHSLTAEFSKPLEAPEKENIIIKNNSLVISGEDIWQREPAMGETTKLTITLKPGKVLSEGDYTFEVKIEGSIAMKEFHVDAQGIVTSK
ncbi:MAG: S-layer homology domain-containing protein [Butyricicoccus pullicaecorum]|nr:S-layer homology domain-containing protein [Butyricicoccus pullicaecorum]